MDSSDDEGSHAGHAFDRVGSGGRGDGQQAQARGVLLLSETARRHDRKTAAMTEKSLEKYDWNRKITYFSDRTDILQGDGLHALGQPLDGLREEPFFWLDVCGFSETDLTQIAQVIYNFCNIVFYIRNRRLGCIR